MKTVTSVDPFEAQKEAIGYQLEQIKLIKKNGSTLKRLYEDSKKPIDNIVTFKFTLEGFRYAGLTNYLKDYCHLNSLDLTLEEDKGLLHSHWRGSVKGLESKVYKFWEDLNQSIKEYNSK